MTNDNKQLEVMQDLSIEAYTKNFEVKLSFCNMLLKTQMCPKHFETKEQVLAAILYGQELGFSPIQSLQCINVIQNKPSIDASGIKAKILQHGGRFETIKWDSKECTLKCWRGEWHETFTYTIEDARVQGLANKENWQKMPKNMLFARCVTTLGRNMYADVLKNLHGTEEMMDAPENEEDRKDRVQLEEIKVAVTPPAFFFNFPDGMSDEQVDFMEKNATYNEDTKLWKSTIKLHSKLDKYLVDPAKIRADMAIEGDDIPESFTQSQTEEEELPGLEAEVVKPKELSALEKAKARVAREQNQAKTVQQEIA